jgi:hypothetical protein
VTQQALQQLPAAPLSQQQQQQQQLHLPAGSAALLGSSPPVLGLHLSAALQLHPL